MEIPRTETVPPDVSEETEQTVAFLPAVRGAKKRRLQIRDGDANLDIPLSGNALITTSVTPSKALARQEEFETPEKSSSRAPILED